MKTSCLRLRTGIKRETEGEVTECVPDQIWLETNDSSVGLRWTHQRPTAFSCRWQENIHMCPPPRSPLHPSDPAVYSEISHFIYLYLSCRALQLNWNVKNFSLFFFWLCFCYATVATHTLKQPPPTCCIGIRISGTWFSLILLFVDHFKQSLVM